MTDPPQPRPRSRVLGRVWADLPLRVKGLVVVAIPLLALLLATALFGVALAQDRRAQGAVLHTVNFRLFVDQIVFILNDAADIAILDQERAGLAPATVAAQAVEGILSGVQETSDAARVINLATQQQRTATVLVQPVKQRPRHLQHPLVVADHRQPA